MPRYTIYDVLAVQLDIPEVDPRKKKLDDNSLLNREGSLRCQNSPLPQESPA